MAYAYLLLGVILVVRAIMMGVNRSFTLFVLPIQSDMGWDRTTISLAPSIMLIVLALALFPIGRFVDTKGPKMTMILGIFIAALGSLLMPLTSIPLSFYIFYGLLGLGLQMATGVPTSVLISNWFTKRTGTILGISSAGGGAGSFFLPVPAYLIALWGWRLTYVSLGITLIAIFAPIILLLVKDRPKVEGGSSSQVEVDNPGRELTPIKTVVSKRDVWLLSLAFFGCGSTGGLSEIHFVPYVVEAGLPSTVAVAVLGFMGVPMIIGMLASGPICDKLGKKRPLVIAYVLRTASILLLLGAGRPSPTVLYLFAAIYGYSWVATAVPTMLFSRDFFGIRSMGTVFGLALGVHEVGWALSSFLGGFFHDTLGSYTPLLVLLTFTTLGSIIMSSLIREEPTAKIEVRPS